MVKVYKSAEGCTVVKDGACYHADSFSFDALYGSPEPAQWLENALADGSDFATVEETEETLAGREWLAPVENQEIWAAGVTYYRSREARMEEAEEAGGDRFYDLVYDAERPELFLKATAARARGHGAPIRIRSDSSWDVPEPELTLAINTAGKIFGYTIGNDVSSRSIEGENPLYLPQAKVYRGSCALGPALVIGPPPAVETSIRLEIVRSGDTAFSGGTDLGQLKRGLDELAEFLFRDNEFPTGCLLMTGTGIVPGSDFTLQSGDVVRISIDGLGTLENTVE